MPGPLTSEFNADAVAALPGPAWLLDQRRSSWELFAGLDLPRESEEIWRYSRIEELDLSRYAPRSPGPVLAVDQLPVPLQRLVEAAGPDATLVVSHNGGEGPLLRPQPGLEVVPIGHGPLLDGREPVTALAGPRADVWKAMNGAFVRAPWRVTVRAGAEVAAPLVVVHWLDEDGMAVFPRLEVEVGENASVRVVEIIASADADILAVPLTELSLGRGAAPRVRPGPAPRPAGVATGQPGEPGEPGRHLALNDSGAGRRLRSCAHRLRARGPWWRQSAFGGLLRFW